MYISFFSPKRKKNLYNLLFRFIIIFISGYVTRNNLHFFHTIWAAQASLFISKIFSSSLVLNTNLLSKNDSWVFCALHVCLVNNYKIISLLF
jgi:hypothetical protein